MKKLIIDIKKNSSQMQRWINSIVTAALIFMVCLAGIVLLSAASLAAETSTSSQSIPTASTKFSASLGVDFFSAINTADTQNFSGWYSVALAETWIAPKITLSATAEIQQNYSYVDDVVGQGDFASPIAVALSRDFGGWGILKETNIGVGVGIPVSKEDQRATQLGSVGPRASMKLVYRRVTLVPSLAYSRVFHQYTVRDDGKVNAPDVFAVGTALSFDVTSRFSLGAALRLIHSISYQGVPKSKTAFQGGGSCQWTKAFGTSLGVSTVAGVLAPDGTSTNISVWDPVDTQLDLGMTLSF